ncbi:MAG: GNAT family N-acetyltransferase [Acidobacteria bacterium]|nr:GNAT family N-acetyltransferase [Acidobacteriota bacterium]
MIRPGTAADLPVVEAIQAACPEAAQWPVTEYIDHTLWVAEDGGSVVGFAVWRGLGGGEWELLNLAIDSRFRRRGIARELLAVLPQGLIFIEVRESNVAARNLYENAGFTVIGRRRGYYHSPPEDGIVMELQKW